jgi:hypothetical protein
MGSIAGLVNYSDDEGSSSSGDEAPGNNLTKQNHTFFLLKPCNS